MMPSEGSESKWPIMPGCSNKISGARTPIGPTSESIRFSGMLAIRPQCSPELEETTRAMPLLSPLLILSCVAPTRRSGKKE